MSTTDAPNAPSAPAPPAARAAPPATAAGTGAGRAFAWFTVVAAAIGLLASFVLTLEKIQLLKDPDYVPSCSINPVLSCGSVMRTEQAEAFGFSNTLLGVAGFAMVLAVGAGLLAGARFRRWYWLGLWLGTVLGTVFVHWLIYNSLYEIGALCPYCMVVWAVTFPLFWYTTLHLLTSGVVPVGEGAGARVTAVLREFHWAVPVAWYLVVVMLASIRFWSYWKTLF